MARIFQVRILLMMFKMFHLFPHSHVFSFFRRNRIFYDLSFFSENVLRKRCATVGSQSIRCSLRTLSLSHDFNGVLCLFDSYSFSLFLKTYGNLNSASFYFNTITFAIWFFPFVSFFIVVITANYCRLWVSWRPATLLGRESNTGVSCEYWKKLRTIFYIEHQRWLFLP